MNFNVAIILALQLSLLIIEFEKSFSATCEKRQIFTDLYFSAFHVIEQTKMNSFQFILSISFHGTSNFEIMIGKSLSRL